MLADKISCVEASAWLTAIGTIAAASVALWFGLQGNRRVREQREELAAAAVRRHNVDLLLRLFDAYALMLSLNRAQMDTVAENQVQLLLGALPKHFAVGLRFHFDPQVGLANTPTLLKYADPGWVMGGQPSLSAIRRELADNLRHEAGA